MVELCMVAPTGWRRERLYRAHSGRLTVAARYLGTLPVYSRSILSPTGEDAGAGVHFQGHG